MYVAREWRSNQSCSTRAQADKPAKYTECAPLTTINKNIYKWSWKRLSGKLAERSFKRSLDQPLDHSLKRLLERPNDQLTKSYANHSELLMNRSYSKNYQWLSIMMSLLIATDCLAAWCVRSICQLRMVHLVNVMHKSVGRNYIVLNNSIFYLRYSSILQDWYLKKSCTRTERMTEKSTIEITYQLAGDKHFLNRRFPHFISTRIN